MLLDMRSLETASRQTDRPDSNGTGDGLDIDRRSGDTHPLDVRARLDKLRELKDGWLDGYGVALDSEGLDWLADSFENLYSSDAPLPRLYPIPEGGVQAEWFIGSYDASLEIDLATRKAEWHNLDFKTDAVSERTLDLGNSSDWKWLSDQTRVLESSAT